jgi:hypothetical protein
LLLVDDILLFPVTGILWLFKEIHKNAQEETSNEAALITQQLRSLYMQLETGRITEEQFDAQEKVLLDRIDELDARGIEDDSDEDSGKLTDETEERESLYKETGKG